MYIDMLRKGNRNQHKKQQLVTKLGLTMLNRMEDQSPSWILIKSY